MNAIVEEADLESLISENADEIITQKMKSGINKTENGYLFCFHPMPTLEHFSTEYYYQKVNEVYSIVEFKLVGLHGLRKPRVVENVLEANASVQEVLRKCFDYALKRAYDVVKPKLEEDNQFNFATFTVNADAEPKRVHFQEDRYNHRKLQQYLAIQHKDW